MNGEWRLVEHDGVIFMRGASIDDSSAIMNHAEKLLGHALPSRNVSILKSFGNGTTYYAIYNGPVYEGDKIYDSLMEWKHKDDGNAPYYTSVNDSGVVSNVLDKHIRKLNIGFGVLGLASIIPIIVSFVLNLSVLLICASVVIPFIVGLIYENVSNKMFFNEILSVKAVDDNNENVIVSYLYRYSSSKKELESALNKIKPVLKAAHIILNDYRIIMDPDDNDTAIGIALIVKDTDAKPDFRCAVDEAISYTSQKAMDYHSIYTVRSFDNFDKDAVIEATGSQAVKPHMIDSNSSKIVTRLRSLQDSIQELETTVMNSNNMTIMVKSQVDNCVNLIKNGSMPADEGSSLITQLESMESTLRVMLPNKIGLDEAQRDLDNVVRLRTRMEN